MSKRGLGPWFFSWPYCALLNFWFPKKNNFVTCSKKVQNANKNHLEGGKLVCHGAFMVFNGTSLTLYLQGKVRCVMPDVPKKIFLHSALP